MDKTLFKQIEALESENYLISFLSNVTAVLKENIRYINWVGFYFYNGTELVLGPFQGLIACNPIQTNKGVCGASFTSREILIVPDVHKFEGHIACDSNSKSEIVLPLIYNDICYGVLDIDSPIENRFTKSDAIILDEIANIISRKLAWHNFDLNPKDIK